jgi:hypothetical protein
MVAFVIAWIDFAAALVVALAAGLIESVTCALELVTVFLARSWTVTTGCRDQGVSFAPPPGCAVKTIFVTGVCTMAQVAPE